MAQQRAQLFLQARQGNLDPEHGLRLARRTAPKQQAQLIVDEAGQGALAVVANELPYPRVIDAKLSEFDELLAETRQETKELAAV